MSTTESPPAEWVQPLMLADQLVIDALPDNVRASVERYIRSGGYAGSSPTSEFARGWTAGAEAMRDEIDSIGIPSVPRKIR